jgi:hypothetical protein
VRPNIGPRHRLINAGGGDRRQSQRRERNAEGLSRCGQAIVMAGEFHWIATVAQKIQHGEVQRIQGPKRDRERFHSSRKHWSRHFDHANAQQQSLRLVPD